MYAPPEVGPLKGLRFAWLTVFFLFHTVAQSQATLPVRTQESQFGEEKVWNSTLLYMEFGVDNGTHGIKSYSPVFIVANTQDANTLQIANGLIEDQGTNPVSGDVGPTEVGDQSPSSPSSSPTDSDRSASSSTSSLDASSEESSSSGSGGLSKGAIAGIAVGVIVGVAVIAAALVWFLCLRRRRRNGGPGGLAGGYGGADGSRAAVMMTEKEAAVGLSSESRDRPSLTQDQMARAGDRGLDSLEHSRGLSGAGVSYSPYADQAVPSSPSSGAAPPGMALTTDGNQGEASPAGLHHPHQHQRSVTGTPTPISSRYAHLVEEGMTEDEIRRLEEEERQLDAAIEEAGNRHTPTR